MNSKQNPSDKTVGISVPPFVLIPAPGPTYEVQTQSGGQKASLTTLIYADREGLFQPLEIGLSSLQRKFTVVHTPLNAIWRLQDRTTAVDAVFVSLQDEKTNVPTFFSFLRDEHPQVRRIAFARQTLRNEIALLTHLCCHHMLLWDPWDKACFVDILKYALDFWVPKKGTN